MVGNLLGFMNAYNLRFGPATTPRQRQAYSQLFGILDQTRDQMLAEAKLESTPLPHANAKNAIDFFQKLDQGSSRTAASRTGEASGPEMSRSNPSSKPA